MPSADQILTTKQVEDRYPFLPAATLRYWRSMGVGPASFSVGSGARGKVLYRVSEIERWLDEREKATSRGGVA